MTTLTTMTTPTTWIYWALLSAVFAALTAIFAKVGIQEVDSDQRSNSDQLKPPAAVVSPPSSPNYQEHREIPPDP